MSKSNKENRNFKDSMFRLVFSEKKNALALYNAVNKTNYTDVEDLEIITLDDALYINVKNDVGCIFHDIMSFFEQQSTYNPNMPLRGLGYISNSLRKYIADTYGDQSVMFREKLIHIPTPRYFVFYNGTRDEPEEQTLRLSNAYDGDGDIEVTAHMFNINKGHNKQLMDACKPLREYAEMVDRVRSSKAESLSNEDAVKKAMDSCIADGILEDILRKEWAVVFDIFLAGLNEEQQRKLIEMNKQDAIDDAVEAAVKEAEKKFSADLQRSQDELHRVQKDLQTARDTIEKAASDKRDAVDRIMCEMGVSLEKACSLVGITTEEYNINL